jgi:hypothetical protein
MVSESDFKSTYHGCLVDRTLAGVSIARALATDGDVPDAVKVLAQRHPVQKVVRRRLVGLAHAQLLHPDADEPGLCKVDQGAGGARGAGAPVHQTDVDLNNRSMRAHIRS